MCLRDAESASTCKASPTCGPQPGVVLTFGSYFWINLWITITLSIPDGYPLPLENHIVSVSAPITTNGTEATSYHCHRRAAWKGVAWGAVYLSTVTPCVCIEPLHFSPVDRLGLGSVVCIPVLYVRVHRRHISCAIYLYLYLYICVYIYIYIYIYKVFYKIQNRGKTHDWCFETF